MEEFLGAQHSGRVSWEVMIGSIETYAVLLADANGTIRNWNRGAELLYGHTAADAIGRHLSLLFPAGEEPKKELRRILNEALRQGHYGREAGQSGADQRLFWAHLTVTTVYAHDGLFLGFTIVARDTSAERLAAERLQATELRFRKLIEQSHDGVSLFDADLKVFFRSRTAERISGWTDLNECNERPADRVHPEDRELVSSLFETVLRQPGTPVTGRYRLLHRDGHHVWVEGVHTNWLDNLSIRAVVCNFRDITGELQATSELVERNQVLERFAYSVSHDLRAPVAKLRALGHLLREFGPDDPDQAFTLDALTAAGEELDRMVIGLNDLLGRTGQAKKA